MRSQPKVWIVSEVYYPDEDGTSYYMTRLAEHLGKYYCVRVICGQPKYTARGVKVPRIETRNGIRIERALDIRLNKNLLPARALSAICVSFFMFLKMAKEFRPGDVVLVVTNPPLLPFLATAACKMRAARCYLRVDDVYPEAMIASEVLPENSFWIRGFRHLNKWLYQNVDKIIVLGRDMERLVRSKMGRNRDRISVIHNWADLETITPSLRASNRLLVDLHIEDKFVIQCAGNMGRVQGIETMFRAAEILKDDGRVHFLFIGNGAKKKWMEEEVSAKGLKNVTLLGFRPRAEQNDFLNACDISMASLVAGMVGAGVPSRMYNVMAAGKPLIAVADPDSELSLVVEEERIGWVVPSGEPARLVDAILDAISDKGRLGRMGESARKSVENKYTADHALVQYLSLIQNRSTAACRANPL